MNDHLTKQYDRLEVVWTFRDDESVKPMQMEEVVPLDKMTGSGPRTYGCRYAHAEWNVLDCSFQHFDGAIRYYSKETYGHRYAGRHKALR